MKTLIALFMMPAGFACAGPIPEAYAERVVEAIRAAEGGDRAKRPYGVLSVPTRSEEHARTICLNSVRNAWGRWEAAGRPGDYLDFLGKRYAPIGASNDPQGLNRHWVRNVRSRLSETKGDLILNVRSRCFSVN